MYWVWLDGKAGVPLHKLQEEIERQSFREAGKVTLGRQFWTWAPALTYLRARMKEGWVCRVYQGEA
jgi:hypothetical protein